jgi:hypothetical protein
MLVEHDQPNPFGVLNTKVTITSSTAPEELEQAYPLLKVKTDAKGQYIHTAHCRFLPGSGFFVSSSGVPTYYFSAKADE